MDGERGAEESPGADHAHPSGAPAAGDEEVAAALDPGPSGPSSPPPALPRANLYVAYYRGGETPPDVHVIPADDPAAALAGTVGLVERLVAEAGGGLPAIACREIISNLVHAGVADAVVSVLDGGNTLRVADRGPGMPDRERALLPGFTTAGSAVRAIVRGVGAGLGLARDSLEALDGSLDIDDNLGGGTVVTAHVPARILPRPAVSAPQAADLSDRRLRALLIILELGPVGPTAIAREMGVSASTAYRDLVALEEKGLVGADGDGLRSATDEGIAYLQTVL